jgi:hypothetical protein
MVKFVEQNLIGCQKLHKASPKKYLGGFSESMVPNCGMRQILTPKRNRRPLTNILLGSPQTYCIFLFNKLPTKITSCSEFNRKNLCSNQKTWLNIIVENNVKKKFLNHAKVIIKRLHICNLSFFFYSLILYAPLCCFSLCYRLISIETN